MSKSDGGDFAQISRSFRYAGLGTKLGFRLTREDLGLAPLVT